MNFLNIEEAEMISEFDTILNNHRKNGNHPQVVKINKKFAEIMMGQVRPDDTTLEHTDTGFKWNTMGIILTWDEWKEDKDLKIIEGKVYRRIE